MEDALELTVVLEGRETWREMTRAAVPRPGTLGRILMDARPPDPAMDPLRRAILREVVGPSIEEADVRARSLLLAHLSPEQRETWTASYAIRVQVDHPRYGGVYLVSGHTKTDRFTDGRRTHVYCLQAMQPFVPDDDRVLAEVLLLTYDIERYHQTANVLWDREVEEAEDLWLAGLTTFHGTMQTVVEGINAFIQLGQMLGEIFAEAAAIVDETVRSVLGRSGPLTRPATFSDADLAEWVRYFDRTIDEAENRRYGRGPPGAYLSLSSEYQATEPDGGDFVRLREEQE